MRPLAASLVLLAVLAGGCLVVGPEQVVVSAASSLTEAMAALETAYEDAHPDTDVVVNTAGSQVLASQAVSGAPVDVLVAADPRAVRTVTEAGLGIAEPLRVAGNRLVVVVPSGNPDGVEELADLSDLDVVLGAPEVPVGAYAAELLASAGVEVDPVSLEPDARAVVARVASGDADAAIAYATDATAVEGVFGIAVEGDLQPDIAYEALLLTTDGEGFYEFLVSEEGQAVLRGHGFSGR